MESIIAILILVFIFFPLFTSVNWNTHRFNTINKTNVWGYGNFKQFKKEFNKIEWRYDSLFPSSFFCADPRGTEIHAGVIKFNNKGMVLTPLAYIPVHIFLYRMKKRTKFTKKYKNLWNTPW